MAGVFAFQKLLGDPTLGLGDFVTLTTASTGAGSFGGIDNPGLFHLVGTGSVQAAQPVVYAPLALRYNQAVKLDVDFAAGNFRLYVLDAKGNVVGQNDDGGATDSGSPGTADPRLTFKAPASGVYFLAVTSFDNAYLGDWQFENHGTATGNFQLDIAAAGLPPLSTVDFTSNFIRNDTANYRVLGNNNGNIINFHNAVGVDIAEGRGGNDNIALGVGNDVGRGGGGNDAVSGENGSDVMAGGTGDDQVAGGAGNDQMFGGIGDDYLTPGLGNDWVSGGAGIDRIVFVFDGGSGVRVDLTAGTVTGGQGADTVSGIEKIIGTLFSDNLKGNAQANDIQGLNGHDTIEGAAGNDLLYGQGGNDSLTGGTGIDSLFGDVGEDTLAGGIADDLLSGGGDNDVIDGNAGEDTLTGEDGIDDLQGGADGDSLDGGADRDTLAGQAGNDSCAGGAGDDNIDGGIDNDSLGGGGDADFVRGDIGKDTVAGDAGNDILDGGLDEDTVDGGEGDDRIYGGGDSGGSNRDVLTGGEGKDRFDFYSTANSRPGPASDRIADFDSGLDKILLTFDGNSTDADPHSAFQFIGDDAFSGQAGQLRYAHTAAGTAVSADLDGNKSADFAIRLDGHLDLFASDFLFSAF